MHNDLNVWSSLSSDLPVVYFVTLLRESVCSYRQWNNHCCLAPLGGGVCSAVLSALMGWWGETDGRG